MQRLLVPIVEGDTRHLEATCQAEPRSGQLIVAVLVGIVPSTLPIGAEVPERWSRLEYQAALARRRGRELGWQVETALVLADRAEVALERLVEELGADAVSLAYQPGWRGFWHRWRDRLWRALPGRLAVPLLLQRVATPRAPVVALQRAALTQLVPRA